MQNREKILIVDDEPTNISILLTILSPIYDIFVATNGKVALEIVQKNYNLDLILLDIVMPSMSGFEVIEALKSDSNSADIPIIFITAMSEADSISECFQKGAVDYIQKPFRREELLARVKNHLHTHKLQKEIEQKAIDLKRERDYLETLSKVIPVGVLIYNTKNSKITYSNSNAQDIFEMNEYELLNRECDFFTCLRSDGSSFSKDEHPILLTMKLKKAQKEILIGIKLESKIKWLNLNSEPLFENGEIVNIIVTLTDVTNIIINEKKIENLNRELEAITNNIPNVIYRCEMNTNFTMRYLNRAIFELSGYRVDELINDRIATFTSLIYPEDIEMVYDIVNNAILTNSKYNLKYRLIKKSGKVIWVSDYGELIKTLDGKELLEGLMTDITLEVEYQELLKQEVEKQTKEIEQNRRELRVLLDNLPVQIIFKDTKNNILTVNKPVADLLNKKSKDISNLHASELFPDDYERCYADDLEVIKSKKAKLNVIEYKEKNGEESVIESSKIPLFDENGEINRLIVIIKDVTNIKKLEDKTKIQQDILYKQSKSSAMGEMIGAIAHQLKQPINILGLQIQSLTTDYEIEGISLEYLDNFENQAMAQIHHMSNTIDQFRNFLMPNKVRVKYKFLNILENVLSLINSQLKVHRINIIKEIEQDIEIYGISGEMEQVLLNLLNNSKDAILNRQHKERTLVGAINIKASVVEDRALISIQDNGGGIDSKIISRIFESYFTTKGKDGTGIGLYMTKSIIEDSMMGEIKVQNVDFGVKFDISIPLNIAEFLDIDTGDKL